MHGQNCVFPAGRGLAVKLEANPTKPMNGLLHRSPELREVAAVQHECDGDTLACRQKNRHSALIKPPRGRDALASVN